MLEEDQITDEQMHAAVIVAINTVIVALRWFRKILRRRIGTLRHRNIIRQGYLVRLLEGNDATCLNMLRLRKAPFFKLCKILKDRGLLHGTIHVSVEEQVAMFLHTIGHNVRNRVLAHNFLRSGETISRHFYAVLRAIGELRDDMLKRPSIATHNMISSDPRFMPFFKDCIGALDGTHIPACVPKDHVSAFWCRKGYPSQNVLAAIDFSLKFTYVLAGWEGSAHDALVLRNALERPNGLKIPEGKYFLADSGYSTRAGVLSPYRKTRYHLSDYASRRPSNMKELFNLRHSSLRVNVERAFGSLKNRFKILTSHPFFPYRTQVDLVIACCILHNYIMMTGGDELIPTIEEWVPIRHSRNVREEREETQEWVRKRDQIASSMWCAR